MSLVASVSGTVELGGSLSAVFSESETKTGEVTSSGLKIGPGAGPSLIGVSATKGGTIQLTGAKSTPEKQQKQEPKEPKQEPSLFSSLWNWLTN